MSSILSARTPVNAQTNPDLFRVIETMPPGAILSLQDVTWDEYEDLLGRMEGRPAIQLTYDHGRLQIMSPSAEHEGITNLFAPLLLVLAEECGMNYISLGHTTLRKRK